MKSKGSSNLNDIRVLQLQCTKNLKGCYGYQLKINGMADAVADTVGQPTPEIVLTAILLIAIAAPLNKMNIGVKIGRLFSIKCHITI